MRILAAAVPVLAMLVLSAPGCGDSKPPTGATAGPAEDPATATARVKAMEDASKAAPSTPQPK